MQIFQRKARHTTAKIETQAAGFFDFDSPSGSRIDRAIGINDAVGLVWRRADLTKPKQRPERFQFSCSFIKLIHHGVDRIYFSVCCVQGGSNGRLA